MRFIELKMANDDKLRHGNVPEFFVNNYNWHEGWANLSLPVNLLLRLEI